MIVNMIFSLTETKIYLLAKQETVVVHICVHTVLQYSPLILTDIFVNTDNSKARQAKYTRTRWPPKRFRKYSGIVNT